MRVWATDMIHSNCFLFIFHFHVQLPHKVEVGEWIGGVESLLPCVSEMGLLSLNHFLVVTKYSVSSDCLA